MRALITGVTGQDGSYLAELLLKKGYEVYGIIRRDSTTTGNIEHLYQDPAKRFHPLNGDLTDSNLLKTIIRVSQPDEVYNLGAQSNVRKSFDLPEYTGDTTGLGTVRLLGAIQEAGIKTKFYQASSSEMFGKAKEVPQNEYTPFHPRSPYGAAKAYAFWMTVNYRESKGIFACNGILFNHESPRRGMKFVTRKITRAVARIKAGLQNKLYLGNLKAKRDWGYAPEYVEGMWLIMQYDKADDFVLATGETHTVEEFAKEAFSYLGMNWKDYVVYDQRYLRPTDIDMLVGDASKAKRVLGWRPKVKFHELVRIMVDHDVNLLKKELDEIPKSEKTQHKTTKQRKNVSND